MEVIHHHDHKGRRMRREMSPVRLMRPTFKKVQVVYYISRNGHLEHPHFMEVTHLAHQPLRLKDVMDRLIILRGKGMPSLYSWSCKRNYKNGYVWNDLAENDIIHPSEGVEYVLKASLIIEDCTEKLHHLQISNVQQLKLGEENQPKRKSLVSKRQSIPPQTLNNQFHPDDEEEEYEEKTSYTRCTTPHSRRSRGVSTDDVEEFKQEIPKNALIEFNKSFSSPPSTTSSTSLSDKPPNNETNNNNSTRFEDGDPVGSEPLLSRNSMLFSLIACGGSASFRKTVPPPSPPSTAARKSVSGGNLRKGVVCKAALKLALEEDVEMIGCMSENPRFGNLQAEEKEYFSGSIVESITSEERLVGMNEPVLKKSSSYKEERRSTQEEVVEVEKEVKKEKALMKGKCIPRIIF